MKKVCENELKEIFDEFKNGNREAAFEKFHSKYKDLIYGIAFSILKNKEDAEDITQIFFSKLYTMKNEKIPDEKHGSWLYTVTKNEAISALRKKREHFDIDLVYEIEDENDEIDEVINKIQFNKLISRLNDKEKEIVSLKILSNLSFDEISNLLDVPDGTVKWRYYKGVNNLKILIMNFGMFILTFCIGIKVLFSREKVQNKMEESIIPNDENNQNNESSDLNNARTEEAKKEYKNTESSDSKVIEKQEKTEISEKVEVMASKENNYQYLGIGILSTSIIFFSAFLIILLKSKLNSRKKASK